MEYDCLIIDDEKLLADSTAEYFNLFGVRTAVAYSASECRRFFEEDRARLLLLDINLGDGSGFALCRELREKTEIPILFISARNSDDDKIAALHIGGDDYVEKPYSLGVLLAKVKAVLKRCGKGGQGWDTAGYPDGDLQRNPGGGPVRGFGEVDAECRNRSGGRGDGCQSSTGQERYENGRLEIDFPARQVLVEGSPVKLTSLEFKLLSYLVRHENRVITKQELFEQVWEDRFTGDGTLNVHIRRLREAIEREPGKPKYILTVWGDGYRFCGEEK